MADTYWGLVVCGHVKERGEGLPSSSPLLEVIEPRDLGRFRGIVFERTSLWHRTVVFPDKPWRRVLYDVWTCQADTEDDVLAYLRDVEATAMAG